MPYSKQDLKELKSRLNKLSDEKYRIFNESLVPDAGMESLGVRTPILRGIAKEIAAGDFRGFLETAKDETLHEMRMLSGMVVAAAKCDFDERTRLLKDFIPRINNWAVCDIVSGDLKPFRKNRDKAFEFLVPYLSSRSEFEVRFATVCLMQHFMTEEFADRILYIYNNVRHDGYYVKMAVAWGVSVCFVKFRDRTLEFLKDCSLDDFTFNKSIQKIRESYRVSDRDKRLLLSMKRPPVRP